jgi:hypothetical protein
MGAEPKADVHDPEVSSLMTVIAARGAARTQKTIDATPVVSG